MRRQIVDRVFGGVCGLISAAILTFVVLILTEFKFDEIMLVLVLGGAAYGAIMGGLFPQFGRKVASFVLQIFA